MATRSNEIPRDFVPAHVQGLERLERGGGHVDVAVLARLALVPDLDLHGVGRGRVGDAHPPAAHRVLVRVRRGEPVERQGGDHVRVRVRLAARRQPQVVVRHVAGLLGQPVRRRRRRLCRLLVGPNARRI